MSTHETAIQKTSCLGQNFAKRKTATCCSGPYSGRSRSDAVHLRKRVCTLKASRGMYFGVRRLRPVTNEEGAEAAGKP